MTADRLSRALESMILTLASAIRAASAVKIHRVPASADLARLGISADAFRAIRQI